MLKYREYIHSKTGCGLLLGGGHIVLGDLSLGRVGWSITWLVHRDLTFRVYVYS